MNDQQLQQMPRSEAEISVAAEAFLLTHLGAPCLAAREIRSHGTARTDLVFLTDSELIGVEVKRTDWKRALSQAALNRFCVDRSYIAVWKSLVHADLLAEAERLGLGVISLSPTSSDVLLEAPLAFPHPALRRKMETRVREQSR